MLMNDAERSHVFKIGSDIEIAQHFATVLERRLGWVARGCDYYDAGYFSEDRQKWVHISRDWLTRRLFEFDGMAVDNPRSPRRLKMSVARCHKVIGVLRMLLDDANARADYEARHSRAEFEAIGARAEYESFDERAERDEKERERWAKGCLARERRAERERRRRSAAAIASSSKGEGGFLS